MRVHMLIRVIESNFNKYSLLDLGLVHGLGSSVCVRRAAIS
ncbi:MAG TPA: hypothetical protein VIG57_07210 [Candidatus Entotheonella sp.]|jgi:hypothetical protein